MGALVGLGVGVGLLLVWSAFFVPVRPRASGRHGRTAELLARAGLGEVSITGFLVLCLVVGAAAAFVVQVVSRTPPVALTFGLIGGYLPGAVVRGQARAGHLEILGDWPRPVENPGPRGGRRPGLPGA